DSQTPTLAILTDYGNSERVSIFTAAQEQNGGCRIGFGIMRLLRVSASKWQPRPWTKRLPCSTRRENDGWKRSCIGCVEIFGCQMDRRAKRKRIISWRFRLLANKARCCTSFDRR